PQLPLRLAAGIQGGRARTPARRPPSHHRAPPRALGTRGSVQADVEHRVGSHRGQPHHDRRRDRGCPSARGSAAAPARRRGPGDPPARGRRRVPRPHGSAGIPLTHALVRELHRLATHDLVREGDASPGEYRTREVEISGSAHIPPLASTVHSLMSDLLDFANTPAEPHMQLIRMAIAHHRFVWVHIEWADFVLEGLLRDLEALHRIAERDTLRRLVDSSIDRAQRAAQLTGVEAAALSAVSSGRPFRSRDLTDALGTDASARSRVIGALLERDLIARLHPGGRIYRLRLTP